MAHGDIERRWLIFCMRRNIWWQADECGYTEDIREAGLYTDAQALAVVERMNDGGDDAVQLVPAGAAGREFYVAKGVKEIRSRARSGPARNVG